MTETVMTIEVNMYQNVTMSDLLIGLSNGKGRVKKWQERKPKVKTKSTDKKK